MERKSFENERMEVVRVTSGEGFKKEGLLSGEHIGRVEVSTKSEELEGCGRGLAGHVLREHLGISRLAILHEEDPAPNGNARFSFIR